jgi:hypothetical protein
MAANPFTKWRSYSKPYMKALFNFSAQPSRAALSIFSASPISSRRDRYGKRESRFNYWTVVAIEATYSGYSGVSGALTPSAVNTFNCSM